MKVEKVRIIDDIGLREKYYIKKGDVLPAVSFNDPARYAEKFEPKRAGCMVNIGPGRDIHLYSYEYELVGGRVTCMTTEELIIVLERQLDNVGLELFRDVLEKVKAGAYEEAARAAEETKRTEWASGAYEARSAIDGCVQAIRALKSASAPVLK